MRILDRYMLREFLLPWVYSFDAMATLVATVMMLDRIDEFTRGHANAGQIGLYLLNLLPTIFVVLLPISLLLGTLFCLSNLGKNGELQAMRASGLSSLRMAVPLLVVAAVASVGSFYLNEYWAIGAEARAAALIDQFKGRTASHEIKNFFYTNEQDRRSWQAASFDTTKQQMLGVTINQANPDHSIALDIFAERVAWENRAWRFQGVSLFDYRDTNLPNVRVAETNFSFLTETPARLALEAKLPDQLTIPQLRRHIRNLTRAQRDEKALPYAVELHSRYAFPVTCFIVVWLAVPLAMKVSRRGPMFGIGIALILVVGFFFLTHIASALGNGGHCQPALAAWLPNVTAGLVGGWLFWRNR